jgi:dihydrofolate reductase
MNIHLIVAAAENNAIGKDNRLLWRLPEDMKFFKEKTSNHCVITGRKNYESIPEKFRPLPGRTNIVVTRQEKYEAPGAIVVSDIAAALQRAKELGEEEVFIIGGGEIYQQTISIADVIWLTRVHHSFDALTFFPQLDESLWKEVWREEHAVNEKHDYAFTFLKYERR